jgi:hypothetical protein
MPRPSRSFQGRCNVNARCRLGHRWPGQGVAGLLGGESRATAASLQSPPQSSSVPDACRGPLSRDEPLPFTFTFTLHLSSVSLPPSSMAPSPKSAGRSGSQSEISPFDRSASGLMVAQARAYPPMLPPLSPLRLRSLDLISELEAALFFFIRVPAAAAFPDRLGKGRGRHDSLRGRPRVRHAWRAPCPTRHSECCVGRGQSLSDVDISARPASLVSFSEPWDCFAAYRSHFVSPRECATRAHASCGAKKTAGSLALSALNSADQHANSGASEDCLLWDLGPLRLNPADLRLCRAFFSSSFLPFLHRSLSYERASGPLLIQELPLDRRISAQRYALEIDRLSALPSRSHSRLF